MNPKIEESRIRKPLWFTTPPVPYPYVLINAHKPKVSYLLHFRDIIKAVIIDSGIEIFRDPKVKDYPKGHIWKIVSLYNKVKRLFPHAEVYATIPDYCDDYHPQNLWLSEEITNIERTVENVVTWTEKLDYVKWLIPVQGWHRNPHSFRRCIRQFEDYGIIKEQEYFAIGNLCVETNKKMVHQTVKIGRQLLPNKKLHIFGLKLTAVPLVKDYIDSFDSTAWTRPVDKTLKVNGVGWSCKTKEERIKFFNRWLQRLEKITSQNTLSGHVI